MRPNGLPGLRGTEHIGITVPDLTAAVAFFCDVIGCELVYSTGRFGGDGAYMAGRLNVHPDAVIEGVALLRCGNGCNYELFQYSSPDQRAVAARNSDIGGYHVCFYVDDIDAAADYLRANGVRLLGTPLTQTEGKIAGESFLYFLAPWGLQMELISYPNGKGYEKETTARLWDPRSTNAPKSPFVRLR